MGSAGRRFTVSPLAPSFGAEILGLDYSEPISDEDFQSIKSIAEEYGVVVLRNTTFDDAFMVELGRRFGEVDSSSPHWNKDIPPRVPNEHIFDVSNLNEKNEIFDENDPKRIAVANANALWHSDGQYNPLRTSWSLLRAVEIPPTEIGGQTEFLDTRTAYDDLPSEMKAKVVGLVGMNNMYHRVKIANPQNKTYNDLNPLDYPFAKHKITSMQDTTGRSTLYVSSYTSHIDGMPVEEGQNLIKELLDYMTQDKYKLIVKWYAPGDVTIWDNTTVLHRATLGEFRSKYRRDMRRVSVLDNSKEAYGLNSQEDMWRQGAP
jgi:alpha-ketoglutarate-dependent 2,4-dichlorophenoxyacetate dioxygenase